MYLMVFSGTTIIKVDVYVHVPDGILPVLLLLRWMYTTCIWWYSPGTTIIKVDVYVHVPDGILRVLLLLRWMYTTCIWWYSPGTTIIKVDVYYMYLMVFSGYYYY